MALSAPHLGGMIAILDCCFLIIRNNEQVYLIITLPLKTLNSMACTVGFFNERCEFPGDLISPPVADEHLP